MLENILALESGVFLRMSKLKDARDAQIRQLRLL